MSDFSLFDGVYIEQPELELQLRQTHYMKWESTADAQMTFILGKTGLFESIVKNNKLGTKLRTE